MLQNTIYILSWVGIAQALFIIALLLIRRQKLADNVLCVWIGLLGMTFAQNFIQQIFGGNTWMGSIAIYLAISASIYLYSKYIVDTYDRFQPKDWLHYAPSIFFVLFIIVTNKVPGLKCDNFTLYYQRYHLVFFIFAFYFLGATVVYLYLSIKKIIRFRKQIFDAYSYNTNQLHLNWLLALFLIQIFYIGANCYVGYANYVNHFSFADRIVLAVCTLSMIYLLSFGGILQKQLVIAGSTNEQPKDNAQSIENEKDGKKPDEDILKPFATQLINYIEGSKAWRDSELSIAKLSKATGIQKHQITQTLNEYIGKNFYTLINGYRIEEAKQMLHDEKYKNYTFMSIAYDCGFNSKTAFYTAFKKITGTTPTEYQKTAK